MRTIGSACAGSWAMTWMSRCPIIQASRAFVLAMELRCFVASSMPLSTSASKQDWSGGRSSTLMRPRSMPTPQWSRSSRALRSRSICESSLPRKGKKSLLLMRSHLCPQAKLEPRLPRRSVKRHLHPARHQCLPSLSVNPRSRLPFNCLPPWKLLSERT